LKETVLVQSSDLSAILRRYSVSLDELLCGDVEVPPTEQPLVVTDAVGGDVGCVDAACSSLDLPLHPARANARRVSAAIRFTNVRGS